MDVCCECCVLSGRDLCDGTITRPEESYRMWDLEISRMMRSCSAGGGGGCRAKNKQNKARILRMRSAGRDICSMVVGNNLFRWCRLFSENAVPPLREHSNTVIRTSAVNKTSDT